MDNREPDISKLIKALERLHLADHPCFIYRSSAELYSVVSLFIRIGLQRNDKCLYIVYDNEPEVVLEFLEKDGLDTSSALDRGALKVVKAEVFYPVNEPYDPERLHGLVRREVTDAHAAGFDSLRIVNDMKWIHERITGTEQLVEHVTQMNDFYAENNIEVLRLYNSTQLTPETLLDVIHIHPKVIFNSAVCTNISYRSREDSFRSGKADFEVEHLLWGMLDIEKRFEDLQTENDLLKAVVENTSDIIFLKDLNGRYLLMNQAGTAFLGKKIEDVLGRTDSELFLQEDAEQINVMDQQVKESGKVVTIEKTLSANGVSRVFLATKGVYCDQKGHIIGTFGVSRDISARKKNEEQLRDSEVRYRRLFEVVTDAIFLVDRETYRFLDANMAAQEMYGYSLEEFLNLTALDLTAEPEKTRQAIATNKIRGSIRLHRKKDGTVFPVEVSGGHFEFLGRDVHVAAIRDISDRMQAEKALKLSEERLRFALTASETGIWEWDITTDKVFMSEECARIMGDPGTEWSIESFNKMLHPDDAESVLAAVNRAVMYNSVYKSEHRIVRPDGEVRHISDIGRAEYDENGIPVRMIATVNDVTQRKQVEKTIIAYQEQLSSLASELVLTEERERRKIATALHDQIGQTLALANIKLGALRQKEGAGLLSDSINDIRELVNTAIKSSHTLIFEISPPVLYELGLEAALSSLAEYFRKEHGLPIVYSDDKQPKQLSNDISILLFQSVRELLVNTVKHSRAKRVSLSSSRQTSNIRIIVQDDGIGFEVEEKCVAKEPGHGFGLFSIRERIRYLGGSIEIESNPGCGTRVTLMAPLMTGKKLMEAPE
jgi:PAS domain S-box-containing protein